MAQPTTNTTPGPPRIGRLRTNTHTGMAVFSNLSWEIRKGLGMKHENRKSGFQDRAHSTALPFSRKKYIWTLPFAVKFKPKTVRHWKEDRIPFPKNPVSTVLTCMSSPRTMFSLMNAHRNKYSFRGDTDSHISKPSSYIKFHCKNFGRIKTNTHVIAVTLLHKTHRHTEQSIQTSSLTNPISLLIREKQV